MNFDELWDITTRWAEEQWQNIQSNGQPLPEAYVEIARLVGVQHPEHIRTLLVRVVPFPQDVRLIEIGRQVGFEQSGTTGLTIGYGIFIREDETTNRGLWAHELRHVAQAEAFGSIRNATFVYLRELLHFRYGYGPMEVDAKAAEARFQNEPDSTAARNPGS